MRRGFCGGPVLLLTAGVVCGVGSIADAGDAGAASGARVVKTVTYGDASREDPDAPDIRTVAISNSEASSPSSTAIRFRIAISNRPVLTRDMRIAMWIDADHDPRTGLAEGGVLSGADYLVNWDLKLRRDASLLRCSRSRCTAASARTFRFAYSRGATFTVQAADLGDTRRFRLAVRAYSGITGSADTGLDFSDSHVDFAPTEGAWTYRVLFRRPAATRGGRTVRVRFAVTRADGSPVTRGRVTCTAMVGGKRVVPRSGGFVGGRATCVFALPLGAAGKTIRGTITVVSGGTRVSKTFEHRIR